MQRVMLGMSGGVDSSVAAALLKNDYEVLGATLRLFDNTLQEAGELSEESKKALAVCTALNIPHTEIDLKEEFKKSIIADFIREYSLGNTPNPCVLCNKEIKFGLFLDEAIKRGCDFIASGHYAKKQRQGERFIIEKAADTSKDQTYMLWSLKQSQIAPALFPLGSLKKSEVRQIAQELKLINAKQKDSQDICFVENGKYGEFIEGFGNKKFPKGSFLDINGNALGEHQGIINYTIGQRKGLGVSFGRPQFVIKKDAENNTVTLGDEDALFYKYVKVDNTNFIPFDNLEGDLRVKAKLRYRQKETDAILHPMEKNSLIIEFKELQRAPSSGQSAVFYDGETLLGGGIIKEGYNLK